MSKRERDLGERPETLPSAAAALDDEEAAEKRAQHRERTLADVVKEYGVKEGQAVQQPAQQPVKEQPNVKVVDDDPEAMAKLRDPYRNTQPPRQGDVVWTRDAYGNIVPMAV